MKFKTIIFTFSKSSDPGHGAPVWAFWSRSELFENIIWILYRGLSEWKGSRECTAVQIFTVFTGTITLWQQLPAFNCIKQFHWLIGLFWPIRFDVTIVSIWKQMFPFGNNCTVKPDWPESPLQTIAKSNLIGQNHLVNQSNSLYNSDLPVTMTTEQTYPNYTSLLEKGHQI